jgi:hypothetical protein
MNMLKTTTIAACVLALSSGVALAQMNAPGPYAAPGTGGSAPATGMGNPGASTQDTVGSGTRSTTGMSQSNRYQSTTGMPRGDYNSGAQTQHGAQPMYSDQPMYPNQAQGGMMGGSADNPRGIAITDEYGNQYNSRGDKIGRGRPARMAR